ncbi:MAG: hypothetical protein HYR70_04230 [Chloroflexi bacterium]|nr:hypothetical protein [Chloroflexota bacterium]MBI3340764.1 hypothetical protein [Chloroflexota bacterium]
MSQVWTDITWVINGFLAIVYYAADHTLIIALTISAAFFTAYTPKEQKAWSAGSSAMAILASFSTPTPVPLFLLVISLAGWVGQWLEQYNRPAQRWNTIRGLGMYALVGLGFAAYRNLGFGNSVVSDPMIAQGAGYLNAIIGIAMYVIPLGFLAMLAQSVWAHPPSATPEDLITKVRTRGKQ